MGVPELLKFVAKTTPNALFKVPCGGVNDNPQLLKSFDFVLVDATNLAQTVGFKRLVSLLTSPVIKVNTALIFVFDSQRRRVGTAREHRTAHHTTQDFELLVHKVADEIRVEWKLRGNVTCEIMMSGRDVAGEADYKMLHMHRSLTSAAAAAGKVAPTFLLVSEDSDVLCGALCGPCPQKVTLATSLQETTMELCLLPLEHVLAYVGQCADVLLYNDSISVGASAQAETEAPTFLNSSAEPLPSEVSRGIVSESSGADDADAGRRKKKDGPMVATGTKIKLDDSDDSGDDVEVPLAAPSKPSAPAPATSTPSTTFAAPSAKALEVAGHLRHVCVDFVFLFTMIMGNNNNVPALARGATKVDMQTCWQLYCRKKYSVDPMTGEDRVNTLLSVTSGSKKNDWKAYVSLNTTFLSTVLHNINYSDHLSRPPVLEERERATKYLARAIGAAVRYVVGCHVDGAPPLQVGDKQFRCYLDTRHDGAEEDLTPSLAALFAVLADETSHTFIVPMRGEVIAAFQETSHYQRPGASSIGKAQQETDIDGSLVILQERHSGGVAQRRSSFAHLTAVSSWKTVASSVDALTRHLPSSLGQYERLDQSWSSMTAVGIEGIQQLARGVAKIIRAQQHSGNNTSDKKKQKDRQKEQSQTTPCEQIQTAYSFELRRMAPVLSSIATAGQPVESIKPVSEKASPSSSKLALMRAAGISFGYAVTPPDPPQEALSEFVMKEFKSKGSKKGADATTIKKPKASPVPPTEPTTDVAPAAKGSKRLGKKERMKLKRQREETES